MWQKGIKLHSQVLIILIDIMYSVYFIMLIQMYSIAKGK